MCSPSRWRTPCGQPAHPRCQAMKSGSRSSDHCVNSMRWPICGSPRSTDRSRLPTISSGRSKLCAQPARLPRRAEPSSVDLLDAVVDDAPGDTYPAFRAPLGMDHRTLALQNRQIAAEVIGDPHRRSPGRLILRYAEIRREHPRPNRTALAVGPRPQVVLDVVGIILWVRGEEFIGRLEVVDGELRRRYIDEHRFAVTQFGRYQLPLAGLGLARVDDAEGIAEAAVLVGENAQHCHDDGMWPMLRGQNQVALRSSAP